MTAVSLPMYMLNKTAVLTQPLLYSKISACRLLLNPNFSGQLVKTVATQPKLA